MENALAEAFTPRYSPRPIGWKTVEPSRRTLTWWWRIGLTLLGVGLIAPLAVASTLTPSATGMGTHQQLGLPPCTMVAFFGVRCPSCGMTTSWALATHGRLWAACQANAGGLLLALIAALAGPWSLVSGVRGRWLWGAPSDRLLTVVSVLVVVVTIADWAMRVWG